MPDPSPDDGLAVPTYPLGHGDAIPALGLGLYQVPEGPVAEGIVTTALEIGYRLLDTAKLYGNEASVGRAVRASGVAREEVFVTTKLWNADHGHDAALRAFRRSLDRLGLDYVDLYLVHWPVEGRREATWKALETLLDDGACRAIGVSNYMVHHLEELLGYADILPAVNQIELSPYNYRGRQGVVDRCGKEGIVVEAYSPLTKGHRLGDPRLAALGDGHGKSPAQVLLRWGLQHGFVEIPKAAHPGHLRENFDVFDFTLTDAEMDRLDRFDEGLATSWDPTDAP